MKNIARWLPSMVSLLLAGEVCAAELTLQRNDMMDWDASGNWIGYGLGDRYASSWAQLAGHGYWDGVDAVVAGNVYVIPTGLALRMGGDAVDPFPGDMLVLKGSSSSFVTYSSKDFGPSLIRVDGSDARFDCYVGAGAGKAIMTSDCAARYSGPLFLNLSAPENRVIVSSGQRHSGHVFSGKITGRGTFRMYTYNLATGGKGWGAPEDYLNITNVLCRDRLEVTGDTSEADISFELNSGNRLLLGCDVVRKVWVREMGEQSGDPARTPYNGAVLGVSSDDRKPKVGELKIGNYTSLEVPVSTDALDAGYLTVTNKIEFTKVDSSEPLVIKVLFRTKPIELRNGLERMLPVLKLDAYAEGSIDPSSFEYAGTLDRSAADFRRFETSVDASGTTLYAVFGQLYPLVRQQYTMTGDPTKIFPNSWAEETSKTVGDVTYYFWDDEREIRSGHDYYAVKGIRLPRGEFPGESLIISNGVWAVFNWGERINVDDVAKTCTIGNLLVEENAGFGIWNDSTKDYRHYAVLAGNLTVNGLLQVSANENRRHGLRIKSKIVAGIGAEVRVTKPTQIDETQESHKINPEYFRPDVRLEGDCTEFFGTFTVETNAIGGVVSFPGTLKARNGSIVRPIDSGTRAVMKTGMIENNVILEFPCDPENDTSGSISFANGCQIGNGCTIRPVGDFTNLQSRKFSMTLLSVPDDGLSTELLPEMFEYDFSQAVRPSSSTWGVEVVKADGVANLVMSFGRRGLSLVFR